MLTLTGYNRPFSRSMKAVHIVLSCMGDVPIRLPRQGDAGLVSMSTCMPRWRRIRTFTRTHGHTFRHSRSHIWTPIHKQAH